MGAHIAFTRAPALHDSNGWALPLEFSMAAILSSGSRNLCSRSAAHVVGITDPGYSGGCAHHFDERRSVYLPDDWFLHSSAWLDFWWIGRGLVFVGIARTPFQISTVGACCNHILRVPGNVSLHPDKLRSSHIQFFSGTA